MKNELRKELHWKHKPFPELVRLAWPITVSMLSYSVMTLVDTLFVGRLGATALAGVGLGGVVAFTVVCFGFGLLRSVKVLVSQAIGAGRRETVPALVSAGLATALALGALLVLLSRIVVAWLPGLAEDGASGALAALYFAVRTLGAPIALSGVVLREARYGLGDSKSPMRAAVAANVVNVGLDALFIFGLELGVAGAAWATVAAQVLETGLLLRVQAREGLGLRALSFERVADVFRIGLPLGLQFVLEVGSFAVLVVMLARISAVDVAAHQIALQVTHFSFLPAFALGEAASVLTGQAVGAGEDGLVRVVARRTLLAASIYTGTCGLVMALGATYIASSFTTDAAVIATAVQLFWVAACFQIFDGANSVARSVLRGTGDVRVPAVLAVGIAWLCTPPLTWLLGERLGLGAVGGWLGLCLEIIAGALVLWWRLERGHWLPKARESRERLARAHEKRADVSVAVA